MAHAKLTHPSRPDLVFRQAQRDAEAVEAVANIAPEIGTDRNPLVHIETREQSRSLTGRVTGPRRAEADTTTADWQQALANYADRLEAHVNEFQGRGYTLEDSIREQSLNAVYHTVEWTLKPGVPYELEFSAEVDIGRGTFDSGPIQRRNPTINTGMSVAATVGGEELPGLRQLQVRRSFATEVNAVYGKGNAENNDIVAQEGPRQRVTFEGTHTGDDSTRAAADDALKALEGSQVTLQTRFPGYSLDGYVIGYDTNLEQRFGEQSHHFTLEFVEGEPA